MTAEPGPSGYQPVVEITRGDTVESLHYGAVAVADASGRVVASWGNPETVSFLRSSAKPFQALPLLESGAADSFGLTPRELAIICASHSGTDAHVDLITVVQTKTGVKESDLRCGTHPPYDDETRRRLAAKGQHPGPNRHNCSGKHTGMLSLARYRSEPLDSYEDPSHPVQLRILQAFADMCGLDPQQVHVGIDGCSVPTFAVPLRAAATAYARLADPSSLPPARAAACRRIMGAMTANPDMVAGPGRFDTLLMQAARGRVLCKGGAEGYRGMALAPGALGLGSPALGIAMKVSDGDLGKRSDSPPGQRAAARAALTVLIDLGALDDQAVEALGEFGPQLVTNFRGLLVGEVRSCFHIPRVA